VTDKHDSLICLCANFCNLSVILRLGLDLDKLALTLEQVICMNKE